MQKQAQLGLLFNHEYGDVYMCLWKIKELLPDYTASEYSTTMKTQIQQRTDSNDEEMDSWTLYLIRKKFFFGQKKNRMPGLVLVADNDQHMTHPPVTSALNSIYKWIMGSQ